MTTFAEDVAAHCMTMSLKDGKPVYAFTPQRAMLKRASGGTLDEARNVGWLFHLLTKHRHGGDADEYRLFLIATLIAFDTLFIEQCVKRQRLPTTPRNFGGTLDQIERATFPSAREARLAPKFDPKRSVSPIERRLRLLLDTHMEADGQGDLPFRLRQVVKLVLDKGKGLSAGTGESLINWDALLRDLRDWDDPDKNKSSQKNWAKAFYAYRPPEEAGVPDAVGGANAEDLIDLDEE